MKRAKPHFMSFGPPIPVVPVSDFSRLGLTEEQMAEAWWLCGPSAERNMRRDFRGRALELWQVITCAYLEGLQHGAGLEHEKRRRKATDTGTEIRELGDPVC